MSIRFFKKRFSARNYEDSKIATDSKPNDVVVETTHDSIDDTTEQKQQKSKNKPSKKQETMTENEKFEKAAELVTELKPETKVIKKDKGLIERTESSKIILTEDNKQVLND